MLAVVDVSVVIATHNRAGLVAEAIESVLAQSVPVREVIVVDDGSTDATRDTLTRFGSRIRAIFQKNQGASAARNHAMRLAQGTWLAFLDDDDVWLNTKVEEQLAVIEENPSLGLVYCSDYAVDHQLRIMHERPARVGNRGDVFEKLLVSNFIFTSCVLARRDAVEEAGMMDPNLAFAQDWDLWLKIAAKYPIDFAERPLVYYRHSPAGCLTKDIPGPNRIKEVEVILDSACQLRPIQAACRKAAYHRLQCLWAATWLQEGEQGKALAASLRAMGHRPLSREACRLAVHSVVPPSVKKAAARLLRRNGNGITTFAATRPTDVVASPGVIEPAVTASKRLTAVGHPISGAQEWPPVLILNMSYSGLGIVRSLATRRMRVVGLSADTKACGNSTRLCEVRSAPDSQNQPEELIKYLLRSAEEFRGAVIFPTRDADVLLLDRYRKQLQPHFRLAIPPHESYCAVVDKHNLVKVAAEVGVPVPRTALLETARDLFRIQDAVGFPCVLKPVSSVQWRRADHWEKVGARKAFLVRNMQELKTNYDAVAAVHPQVLVQEWIPGSTNQIVILGGYVNEASAPLGYFTARKLIQSPDDFGTGCLVENAEIPALLEPTERLWRALRYQGMAEVEYKLDARTGEFRLIEINTRHWDWHELGVASGVNVTWIAYCHLTGKPVVPVYPKSVPTKWIAETDLFYYLVRSAYHRELPLRKLWRDLSGRRMYSILAWKDPLLFLRHWFGDYLPALWKQVVKKSLEGKSHQ